MGLRKIPAHRFPTINKSAFDMVAVKPLERRRELLRRATPGVRKIAGREYPTHGLPVHCESGVALKHPDVKWLLKRGYIRLVRVAYGSGWAHDLAHPAPLRRTYAQITEAGCKLFPATPPDKPQRSEGDND